jgi:hypothetical protein
VSRVVLVTARWGAEHGESGDVVRLLAGALSVRTEVEVVSLGTCGFKQSTDAELSTRRDSVFTVHEIAGAPAQTSQENLLRIAFATADASRVPEIAGPRLVELQGGRSPRAVELICSLGADAVVLAGPETWWLPRELRSHKGGLRVVSLPLLGDDPTAELLEFRPLLTQVDAVGVLSGAESRRLVGPTGTFPKPTVPELAPVTELEVAYGINRSAAAQLMVGMSHFGRFVVLLTGFPDATPSAPRSPGHDYVRRALGPIAVAEVGHGRWTISDKTKTREVPVGPSRANLLKLLSHAEVCLDLRPQGIVGRETLESLLLGTPVVVPDHTVAAEHAERSNGGLWYRDYGELFDQAKAIVDDASLRDRLSLKGCAWATEVHGDHGRFCEQAARFALG